MPVWGHQERELLWNGQKSCFQVVPLDPSPFSCRATLVALVSLGSFRQSPTVKAEPARLHLCAEEKCKLFHMWEQNVIAVGRR